MTLLRPWRNSSVKTAIRCAFVLLPLPDLHEGLGCARCYSDESKNETAKRLIFTGRMLFTSAFHTEKWRKALKQHHHRQRRRDQQQLLQMRGVRRQRRHHALQLMHH